MSSNLVVIVLCAASLGATGYLIASRPQAAQDGRIEELEKRLEAAEKRADATDALRAEMGKVAERLDRIAVRSERTPAAFRGESPEVASRAQGDLEQFTASSDAETSSKAMEDAIAERLEKKMEELATRDKDRGADGKWKPPIDELAKELKLTDQQKLDAAKIFDAGRDQSFVLMRTQRLDGGTLLDDFAAALKSGGDPEEATKQLFQRIFTEKVPGSDTTYLVEFMAIHQDVHDRLSRQLGKEQVKRLDALRVDLLDVKTGYDPAGDYIRAKLQ